MGNVWRFLLLTATVVSAGHSFAAQPAAESPLERGDNFCVKCHGDASNWEADTLHLHVTADTLADDIHWQKGLRCHDCHGGDPTSFDPQRAHAVEVGFRKVETAADSTVFCGHCHEQQAERLAGDVHGALSRTESLACTACHQDETHGMVSVQDRRSSVFLDNQVEVCGGCHSESLRGYRESVHGSGLYNSGLLVSASCANCHGAHGIYRATDERSLLHPSQVTATCTACHRYIEDRLAQSVHGGGVGPGQQTELAAPGGQVKRHPSCTDCHVAHDLPHPESDHFRLELSARCGQCHVEQSDQYGLSMHGHLTDLGYGPSANCADCHGGHDILPVSDPNSMVSPANRQETCAKCHVGASQNFANFDPHSDHRNPDRNPLLFVVYCTLLTFLISTFSFFALHSIFWFVRSLIDVIKNGRPKPLTAGDTAYVRFKPRHRMAHTVMVISFLGLALTGLPLKYSDLGWAQTVARWFGGFELTAQWHRLFGVVNIGILGCYIILMLRKLVVRRQKGAPVMSVIFGPDSPVPNRRDLKDLLKMIRWFFGRGPKPSFDRWAYWEKYDFWGASADIVAIGFTGLVLWFPHFFCAFLPGHTLNIAKVIHSTQALLATGFVFAIHFFNTHLRPEKFPMDMSILTGLMSEHEAHEERAEYLERMRRAGKLDQLRTTVPARPRLVTMMVAGAVALAIGVGLLAGIVAPALAR